MLFEVLEYESTKVSLLGTDTTNVIMTAHGLSVGDFIVNTTVRATLQSEVERGSRRVLEVINANEFRVAAISAQNRGDSYRIYKFVNRTEHIKTGTFRLNLKLAGESQSNFTVLSNYTTSLDYYPLEGQLVRYSFDGTKVALNVIDTVSRKLQTEKGNILINRITTRDLKAILSRRNIRINYDEGDSTSDIVEDLIDNFGVSEGIEKGTISPGLILYKEWKNGCINIRQVIDSCAEKNGFQWWIDEDFKLHFLDEEATIPTAPYKISDAINESFKDYRNVETIGDLNGYINKVFVVGNDDGYGNQIFNSKSNLYDQNYMQNLVCGSGVYGAIMQDSNNNEVWVKNSLASTTTTNLNISSHDLRVDDYIYNLSVKTGSYVTAVVDVNNVTVESITGQAPNQTILIFVSSLLRSDEIIKKNKSTNFSPTAVPRILKFDTNNIEFRPGTKLEVSLDKFEIGFTTYFAIESVFISDFNEAGEFVSNVVAIQRNDTYFSTHRKYNGYDFFAKNY